MIFCRRCGEKGEGWNRRLGWLCTRCREEMMDTEITIKIEEDGELVAQAKMDGYNSAIRISQWRRPTKRLNEEYELAPTEHVWAAVCHMLSFLFAIEDRDDLPDSD